MRNLQQIEHNIHAIHNGCNSCYRQSNLVYASLDNGIVSICELNDEDSISLASFDAPDLAPGVQDEIINIHYSDEYDNLCVIMKGGDIITIQLDGTKHSDEIDIIGSIDQTVLAAEWSPDHDILAVSTQDKLSLLTKTFESLAEVAIQDEDIKASATQVSVGWGRAETQFRGKHAPRDPTLPESVDEGTLSPNDVRNHRISWRGDASYLSLSTVGKGRRVIRVYNREGALESTSEPVNGQEDLLCWKPSGNLIAAVRNSISNPGSKECIFFEKNGLRHGEFDLRRSERILDLQWNSDSTVLAVLFVDSIEFWVASNYHYSLKSKVRCSQVSRICWHPEVALTLSLISSSQLYSLSYRWIVHTHKPCPPNDFGLVAMIDGNKLGLTPLRLANVPPPMAFRNLSLASVPRDLAISDDARTISVLYESTLALYAWDLDVKPIRLPCLVMTITLDVEQGILPLQILTDDESRSQVLLSDGQILSITKDTQETFPSVLTDVLTIHNIDDHVYAQNKHGYIQALQGSNVSTKFPERSISVAGIRADTDVTVFGLGSSGKLYADSKTIATKVTSFLILGKLLLYTVSDSLRFIHLTGDLSNDSDLVDDERSRQIERGSVLICSCPSAQSVTLQAPRGNLETIYPRLLVLTSIRNCISARNWTDAWRQAKVHRIDVNIMYDHDPALFLSNIKEFISQLSTSLELDLFLSGLKAEDVTITMYKDTIQTISRSEIKAVASDNKVNTICDCVYSVLVESFESTHLTSMLTCSLSKSPADYDAALSCISQLPRKDVDGAITHVCFLADAHLLYNQALGLYDLPLALLLVQRSQKDPREYVPFLQKMQVLETHRQHFSLDDYLGRHAKALTSLLKIDGSWAEVEAYVQRHSLWQNALDLLRYDASRNQKILALYAEHLVSKQEFAEAAYAYEVIGDYANATESFEAASLWSEALHAAAMAGRPLEALAGRLAERMVDQSKFSEAAIIYNDHLKDTDNATKLFCKAFEFSRAITLASFPDKIEKIVKPCLTDAFVQISELLSEMKVQLSNQIPRLREVREKRDENPDGYFDGVAEDNTPDNVSLAGTQASTTASVYTRYTGMSAITTQSKKSGKAKRRQERQRAKGKKGTIWEEEYLVNSVRRLVERLEQTRGDARNLIVALVRCGMRENATEIQKSMLSLIASARANSDEVFSGILTLPAELQRTMGTKPELKDFEVLSLC